MKFEKVTEFLGNAEANIAAAREHVGEVDITIQTLKEHGRGIVNALTYYYLPSQIIINLVYFIVMWLNEIPSGKGIPQKYPTKEIVTGQHLDFKNHYRVVFWSYVEAHYYPNISNNMASRTDEFLCTKTHWKHTRDT